MTNEELARAIMARAPICRSGLTPREFALLILLLDAPRNIRQIIDGLGLSRASASNLAHTLEAKGHIELWRMRNPDGPSGHVVLARLSPKGVRAVRLRSDKMQPR